MQKSKNFNLNLPEADDYVIIGDLNYNTEELDKLIKAIHDSLDVLDTNGDSLLDLLKKKADLDEKGKVLKDQLPDLDIYKDVLMYNARGNFPGTGNAKKVYVDKATGRIYRWTGSTYAELSKSLEIGDSKGKAFDGARGKAVEDDLKKRYTNDQVDQKLQSTKEEILVEIKSNIVDQIIALS